MNKSISQREARALRKQVRRLTLEREKLVARWATDFPGGVQISSVRLNDTEQAIVQTAISLGHVVVGKKDGQHLRLYAVRIPDEVTL